MKVPQFLRDWSLPVAMVSGAAVYFIYRALPLPQSTGIFVSSVVSVVSLFVILLFVHCFPVVVEKESLQWK